MTSPEGTKIHRKDYFGPERCGVLSPTFSRDIVLNLRMKCIYNSLQDLLRLGRCFYFYTILLLIIIHFLLIKMPFFLKFYISNIPNLKSPFIFLLYFIINKILNEKDMNKKLGNTLNQLLTAFGLED